MDKNPEILGCLHCLQKIRGLLATKLSFAHVYMYVCVRARVISRSARQYLSALAKKETHCSTRELFIERVEYSPSMKNFYNDPNKL